jgi:hypothetical protein
MTMPTAPSTLRFRYRFVHETMALYVRTGLIALGWGDIEVDPDATVNFGTTPLTYVVMQPENEQAPIADNTVIVTLGDEPNAVDEELGDGLRSIEFPTFIDIYGVNQSISQAIASDVKDLLEDKYTPVLDFAEDPPALTSELIELNKDDLLIVHPQSALAATDVRKQWRVVKTFARVHYIKGGAW